ncbi:TadE/TadG family type IV pilus assembly protein [Pusillimonas minor]|uniref:TadE-like domain-containing protein n=1 Tax=Pusillimonas minor TaxID=2697024 RepID=A0A842HMV0_9BURK|nr:TadE/TadG family type IV pilus assembly protein [Pusillimonas minor]MBC2768640.1 hypothetical protein [Pusillimonas minor]
MARFFYLLVLWQNASLPQAVAAPTTRARINRVKKNALAAFGALPRRQHSPHEVWAPQHGTGLIEFLLVAIPLLVTALGGIEISHWMFTRQTISVALVEAGRAGSTEHANPLSIANAFEAALGPLYPGTANLSSAQRVQQALERHRRHHATLPWHIQIVSPSAAAFDDFKTVAPDVRHPGGLPTINNSYQFEQDAAHRQQGRPNGTGPRSAQTIYQANALILRLTYRYKPLLPGLEAIVGHTPALTQEAVIDMQSHPVLWPDDPSGRVTRAPDTAAHRHWPVTDTDAPQPPAEHGTTGPPANDYGEGSPEGSSAGAGNNDGSGSSNTGDHLVPGDGGEGASDSNSGAEGEGASPGESQGEGSSEGNICTNTSPSLTIPNSNLARSSTAAVPDLRS